MTPLHGGSDHPSHHPTPAHTAIKPIPYRAPKQSTHFASGPNHPRPFASPCPNVVQCHDNPSCRWPLGFTLLPQPAALAVRHQSGAQCALGWRKARGGRGAGSGLGHRQNGQLALGTIARSLSCYSFCVGSIAIAVRRHGIVDISRSSRSQYLRAFLSSVPPLPHSAPDFVTTPSTPLFAGISLRFVWVYNPPPTLACFIRS
ncbi:hypothetical protein VTI74DRAFT_1927 [Chaetomium olivicolor]